jgi:hypothetical protein
MNPRVSNHRNRPDHRVSHIPCSLLLSIPSCRPGQKLRSSPIDLFPSTSFGDPVNYKAEGSIRLMFQNVKGLTYSTTLEDYRYYHQCLNGLSVDVIGLADTNTCWSQHHLSSDFRLATQRFHRQSKIIFGSASPAIDLCPQNESFQSGGNLTAVFGEFSSRIAGPSITDSTGLGRWSGVTLEGTSSRKLSIITAYRVCKGSPQSAPLGSSFLREYEYFREQTGKPVNPRRQFLCDLQKLVVSLQESGHCVILMLDANSTIEDRALSEFIISCGLHDLHSRDPSPSTYIGSSDHRIDFIFGCDEAMQLVICSGTLSYTDGPQSDHRSLYVDISPGFIVRTPWSQLASPTSRDLYTGNPELVKNTTLPCYSTTVNIKWSNGSKICTLDINGCLERNFVQLSSSGTMIKAVPWNLVNVYCGVRFTNASGLRLFVIVPSCADIGFFDSASSAVISFCIQLFCVGKLRCNDMILVFRYLSWGLPFPLIKSDLHLPRQAIFFVACSNSRLRFVFSAMKIYWAHIETIRIQQLRPTHNEKQKL